MSIALLMVLVAILGLVPVAAIVGFMLGKRRLPPAGAVHQDRRLAEQVELLEGELQRVKEQADFTEKLLTERDGNEE